VTDDSTRPVAVAAPGGITLPGDLAAPAEARGAAVVCHPHPAYGGDRHNAVVDALFGALPAAGFAALRFDFRPGSGTGGDGTAERGDVVAALDHLAAAVPGVPLWLAGYSFGGDVALGVGDPRHAGWVAVAPPLHFGGPPVPAGGDRRPALVLVPEHDQYSPPARVADATAGWADATVEVVPGVDHFLAGSTRRVAEMAVAWLAQR
jgi:alpha/beta superfamily hydrolase